MGQLVRGVWTADADFPRDADGRFDRAASQFRDMHVEPVAGRYHLYVSLACPWAHRTLVARALLGLEHAIDVSIVEPVWQDNGWQFSDRYPDRLHGARYLWELYVRARADFTGRVTVPVLWDRERDTIVNNESAEILRLLHTAFAPLARTPRDLVPEPHRADIDAINARVYEAVNNGVYKCGFAGTQAAYDEAEAALFAALDELDATLAGRTWLVGDALTEADIRLFPTLVRFDAVYNIHFKCSRKRLVDYPNLLSHTVRMYRLPGVADTVDFDHIKRHYYLCHRSLNPRGIIPVTGQGAYLRLA
ncbi:MAG: glutathione S-transferase family protein [Deltaproteobacteria bacterium]|nr:MAG: glutathione S-transferase family protein [Deltaproteobacteria bacterium]